MHRVLKPLKSRFIKKNASKITSCKKTILGLWIRLWSLDIATKTADTMAVWMLMWDERVESKGKLAIVGISLKWMHESDDLCGPFLFWFVFVAFFKFYFIFLLFFWCDGLWFQCAALPNSICGHLCSLLHFWLIDWMISQGMHDASSVDLRCEWFYSRSIPLNK